jgi:hypothetical protein
VWSLLIMWAGSLAGSFLYGGDRIFEAITVTRDGTPVVQSYSSGNYTVWSYRSLDGEPLTIERENWLSGASLVEPRRPPGLFYPPVEWRSRIIAASDNQNPPNSWYLIRDDQPQGHAYLSGYDEISNFPFGYMARQGFRLAMPPRDQWFDVGLHQFGWGSGAACSTVDLNYGGRAYHRGMGSEEQRLPEWLLFVIDGDRLLEIDMRARKLRPLLTAPGLVAVAMLAEVQTKAPADDDSASLVKSAVPMRTVAHTMQYNFDVIVPLNANHFVPTTEDSSKKVKTETRLAVRTLDRIIILDPPTGAKREFLLPEPWRDQMFDAYAPNDRELLLVRRDWGAGNIYHLQWLVPEGRIIQERTESLAGWGPENERLGAMLATIAAPVPVGWYLLSGTVLPLSFVQENKVPTYMAGLGRALDMVWPALLIETLIGLALAVVVWKWQRKYHRSGTEVWCGFVFLAGLPGLAAYWLEHRRAKLESCGQCGEQVPRDREACAACAAPFLAPPLLGTEIFS